MGSSTWEGIDRVGLALITSLGVGSMFLSCVPLNILQLLSEAFFHIWSCFRDPGVGSDFGDTLYIKIDRHSVNAWVSYIMPKFHTMPVTYIHKGD